MQELIRDGKIVIFSSHQMSYVEEFCEDIVIINHGEIVLSGHLDTIKRDFGKDQLVLSAVDMPPRILLTCFAQSLQTVSI